MTTFPTIHVTQLAVMVRESYAAARGNSAEQAGVGSMVVRIVRALPEEMREKFLIDCGQLREMYWLLGPDYPMPDPE